MATVEANLTRIKSALERIGKKQMDRIEVAVAEGLEKAASELEKFEEKISKDEKK